MDQERPFTTPQADSPEHRFAAAARAFNTGRLAEAENLLLPLLRAFPNHPDIAHLAGVIALEANRPEDARRLLDISLGAAAKAGRADIRPAILGVLGIALRRLGRAEEALAALSEAVVLQPDSADAHHNLANALAAAGHESEAAEHYAAAARLDSSIALTSPHGGTLQAKLATARERHRAGALTEATRLYEDVLRASPDHFDALHMLGVLKLQQSDHAAAIALISRALAVNPLSAEASNNCGMAFDRAGNLAAALQHFDHAVEINPKYLDALYNRGNAFEQLGRLPEAVSSYEAALAIKPDFFETLCNLGLALRRLKRFEEAPQRYTQAVSANPMSAEAVCNLGIVLADIGKYDEALAAYDRALTIKPTYPEAWVNRGNTLKLGARTEEALTNYEKALSIQPDHPEALISQGNVLMELQRLSEARRCYDRVLEMAPNDADAHFGRAANHLLQGEFAEGWREYEWRWEKKSFSSPKREFRQPQWRGEGNVTEKTILLHAEQGFGDTIQFCRYARDLSAKGARVLLEVQPPLKSLLADMEGPALVMARGERLPDFDWHCPLMSLPLAFGTEITSVPAPSPYLHASGELVEKWTRDLGPKRRPRIGLMWSGSATIRDDREIPLRQLAALLKLDLEFFSLQKDVGAGDEAFLREIGTIRHFGPDFANTAALIAAMDLVISIDTSIAHLSGALAKPTWTLLPYLPDWRWLLDRLDSPWYPTMTLFRQSKAGDWVGVIAAVTEKLFQHFNLSGSRDSALER